MKLIFTDPHIETKAIWELDNIFNEILTYNADELIMCGDYYHNNPTPCELLFGTEWARKFKKKYSKVTFLRGNHALKGEISSVDYLKYLGIRVVDKFNDTEGNYFGHFMLHESKLEYGTGKYGLKDFKDFNYVILGHQHNPQSFNKRVHHLGSCRYVHFNEVKDPNKQIALLDKDLKFIPLKNPIPMKDVKSIKELRLAESRTKIRIVISSFKQFKEEINLLSKFKNKFYEFKIKLDFQEPIIESKKEEKKTQKIEEVIREFIDQIEDNEVKKEIETEFKQEGLC